jgi:hypothetical protein
MYPEPGPVRAVDQRITRYSFSPMRLKIHSAVRVWFAISRQVTQDTWVPRISLRCTDLPPVPAARQLGLAADSDRPQAEAAKARSGPERVLPSYSPCSDPRDRETNSSRFRPVSSGVLNLRKGMNRRSGSPGDLRNRSDSAAIGIGSVGRASRTRRRCSAAVKTPSAGGGTLRV